jgi:hypothetical protein
MKSSNATDTKRRASATTVIRNILSHTPPVIALTCSLNQTVAPTLIADTNTAIFVTGAKSLRITNKYS